MVIKWVKITKLVYKSPVSFISTGSVPIVGASISILISGTSVETLGLFIISEFN